MTDYIHDEDELILLGAVLTKPAILDRHPGLTPAIFGDPHRAAVLETIIRLRDDGAELGEIPVHAEMVRTLGKHRADRWTPLKLLELKNLPVVGYQRALQRVAESAQRRRLLTLLARGEQALHHEDLGVGLDVVAKLVLEMENDLDDPLEAGPIAGLSTFDEFIDRPRRPLAWVIPNVLRRLERVIVLAPPGSGKSMLARMVALLVAHGRHPFWPALRVTPQRTLLIDLENPDDVIADKSMPIRDECRTQVEMAGLAWDSDMAHIWHVPQGVDIRRHEDAALLNRVVAATRPALICVGPLYKLAEKHGDDWETVAEETGRALDRVRAKFDCALWIEHHMPKSGNDGGRATPFGSSYWERWPEFGFVLRAAMVDGQASQTLFDWEGYRLPRDERLWPDMGFSRAKQWPWKAEFSMQIEHVFKQMTEAQARTGPLYEGAGGAA